MKNANLKYILLGSVAILAFSQNVFADLSVGPLTITKIRSGWGVDSFAIETTGQSYENPANCQVNDGYLSDKADGGYQTFLNITLRAFGLGKPVTVFLSNTECSRGRPRITGINISK